MGEFVCCAVLLCARAVVVKARVARSLRAKPNIAKPTRYQTAPKPQQVVYIKASVESRPSSSIFFVDYQTWQL